MVISYVLASTACFHSQLSARPVTGHPSATFCTAPPPLRGAGIRRDQPHATAAAQWLDGLPAVVVYTPPPRPPFITPAPHRDYTKLTPDRPGGGVTLNPHQIDLVEGLH